MIIKCKKTDIDYKQDTGVEHTQVNVTGKEEDQSVISQETLKRVTCRICKYFQKPTSH